MDLIVNGVEFFHKGGSIMYVLLLCSFLVVSIAIERWRYFARRDSGRGFTRQFAEAMSAGILARQLVLLKVAVVIWQVY